MARKTSAQKIKTSVRNSEKAKAEAEALAEAAAIAAREASPAGASQAPDSSSLVTDPHVTPQSAAAASAAADEEPADKDESLVTPVNQSLLGQSAPGDAGTTPPLPPGAGGSIAAHQIVGDQKDSVSGFAHQNSPGLNIANRTSASALGVSSDHRSDSSHSGSRNISSVVKVLLGMNNYSEEHSECPNASEEASNASDSVSESSGGQIADLLAIFDSKSAGLCFVDLIVRRLRSSSSGMKPIRE